MCGTITKCLSAQSARPSPRSLALLLTLLTASAASAAPPKKSYVAVFDFKSTPAAAGEQLADSVRIMLRRHEEFDVLDRLSVREAGEAPGLDADPNAVRRTMKEKLAVNVALYGTVVNRGGMTFVEVRCLDQRDPKKPGGWRETFSDGTERARGLLAAAIVEKLRGQAQWKPPEYGDEEEPKTWPKPLNVNGDFEAGGAGWEGPDNVATFLDKAAPRTAAGKTEKSTILRIRTDLDRWPYLDYLRKLRFGQADANKPPTIGRDTSYASLAGMEGVFYRSRWLDAAAGQRYWLTADMKGKTAGIFFPKIFIKGFQDDSARVDALSEQSLVDLKMSAEQYGALPRERQAALLAADKRKNPDRYRRECFRWFLSCRNEEGAWKHYAAPFPPRGGLPANVRWLRIEVYSYWPPGEYLFDNVNLYLDPRQKAPLPEEAARTPNLGRTSDVVEREEREALEKLKREAEKKK